VLSASQNGSSTDSILPDNLDSILTVRNLLILYKNVVFLRNFKALLDKIPVTTTLTMVLWFVSEPGGPGDGGGGERR
jgi:hypothetical protein